jgi:quercetin dioxygenase-like cupin family protein
MASYYLRLFRDYLGAGGSTETPLPPAIRAIYVKSGMLRIHSNGIAASASQNSAFYSSEEIKIIASPEGAELLRYELVSHAAPHSLLSSQNTSTSLLYEATLELEPGDGYLLRCDRVDIPPGGIAYTHTHQGPGIRCLLEGGFTVETQGHKMEISPGEPWFETGGDPVLAYAPPNKVGYFSRLMILPRSLRGKSSISYINPGDAAKPKLQRYTIFLDELISI